MIVDSIPKKKFHSTSLFITRLELRKVLLNLYVFDYIFKMFSTENFSYLGTTFQIFNSQTLSFGKFEKNNPISCKDNNYWTTKSKYYSTSYLLWIVSWIFSFIWISATFISRNLLNPTIHYVVIWSHTVSLLWIEWSNEWSEQDRSTTSKRHTSY